MDDPFTDGPEGYAKYPTRPPMISPRGGQSGATTLTLESDEVDVMHDDSTDRHRMTHMTHMIHTARSDVPSEASDLSVSLSSSSSSYEVAVHPLPPSLTSAPSPLPLPGTPDNPVMGNPGSISPFEAKTMSEWNFGLNKRRGGYLFSSSEDQEYLNAADAWTPVLPLNGGPRAKASLPNARPPVEVVTRMVSPKNSQTSTSSPANSPLKKLRQKSSRPKLQNDFADADFPSRSPPEPLLASSPAPPLSRTHSRSFSLPRTSSSNDRAILSFETTRGPTHHPFVDSVPRNGKHWLDQDPMSVATTPHSAATSYSSQSPRSLIRSPSAASITEVDKTKSSPAVRKRPSFYRKKRAHTASNVVAEVRAAADSNGFPIPSPMTEVVKSMPLSPKRSSSSGNIAAKARGRNDGTTTGKKPTEELSNDYFGNAASSAAVVQRPSKPSLASPAKIVKGNASPRTGGAVGWFASLSGHSRSTSKSKTATPSSTEASPLSISSPFNVVHTSSTMNMVRSNTSMATDPSSSSGSVQARVQVLRISSTTSVVQTRVEPGSPRRKGESEAHPSSKRSGPRQTAGPIEVARGTIHDDPFPPPLPPPSPRRSKSASTATAPSPRSPALEHRKRALTAPGSGSSPGPLQDEATKASSPRISPPTSAPGKDVKKSYSVSPHSPPSPSCKRGPRTTPATPSRTILSPPLTTTSPSAASPSQALANVHCSYQDHDKEAKFLELLTRSDAAQDGVIRLTLGSNTAHTAGLV